MVTASTPSLEVREPLAGRRRRFSRAEKHTILEEASAPGQTLSAVGRKYGLSVSLLFRWRRQLASPERSGKQLTSSHSPIGMRARDLERQVEALQAENALLREAVDRALREARTNVAAPARLGDGLRPDGRA